ncbi:MAG: alpha/beta fold hydrolase [Actinomycetes bacterium]
MHLTTADGVRLSARVLPGPGDVCVVLAHGFGVSTMREPVRRVARALARHATVLAYDARGHGLSGGTSTLGHLEVLDVDVAVVAARGLGDRVVTCGWSMGGAAVVRQAGLRGMAIPTAAGGSVLEHAPDAVVAVSSTARWSERATANRALRRLHAVVETRPGRVWARTVLRTRVAASGWDPLPEAPVDVAPRLAPVPLLVVHGDRDAYFPLSHAEELAAAAEAELLVEPGFGHAEAAASPELLDRIGRRLVGLAPDVERRSA